MDAQLVTLSKIFTERLFRIPDYQRGYAWTTKQLQEFWTDLEQLEPNRNHYTGVLTLEAVPTAKYKTWQDDNWIIQSKSYEPLYVVDGQQRLTTTLILIQCILEQTPDNMKLNYTEKDDIKRKFVYDSKDDEISRSYVFGYEDNNPSYKFLKSNIFRDRVSGPVEETIYTQNLENAKLFFKEKIATFDKEKLELLYRKVTQSLLFNIFTISDDVDVCVAFETMNNRGKPLSYLELLKNRLIYLTTKLPDPPHEVAALRQAINDAWRTIYHNLGRNKDRPLDDDQFLWTHHIIYFGPSNKFSPRRRPSGRDGRPAYAGDLLESIFTTKRLAKDCPSEERLTKNFIHQYVTSLEDSIQTWYDVFNPMKSDFDGDVKIWLDKLDRLGCKPFLPLILVFLQKVNDIKQQVDLLKEVERFLFLMAVHDRYFQEYDIGQIGSFPVEQAWKLLAGDVTGEAIIKDLRERISEILENPRLSEHVQEFFKDRGFYSWRPIRYFLYEYNLSLQEKSKTDRAKIFWPEFIEDRNDYTSVEHIFPKNARHAYWRQRFGSLKGAKRAAVRDSLGNLLPLSKPKNSSLSNKPFPDKVEGKVDGAIAYRFGSYAENEVARYTDWTPETILERGFKMLNFMEKRWGIKLGSDRRKRKILGF